MAVTYNISVSPRLAHIKGPTVIDGKEWWSNTIPYVLKFHGYDRIMRIPEGFSHDGASVPRFFWRLFPALSLYAVAAIVHDYLYRHRGHVTLHAGIARRQEYKVRLSRKEADLIFRELMRQLGVSRWKRNVMYAAVRAGGGDAWDT